MTNTLILIPLTTQLLSVHVANVSDASAMLEMLTTMCGHELDQSDSESVVLSQARRARGRPLLRELRRLWRLVRAMTTEITADVVCVS